MTLEEAKDLVKTKEHLYKAMTRNRWFLPKFKSSIITQEYMKGVRAKKLWCPMYDDLKPLPCPDPPSKETLLDEVVKYTLLTATLTSEQRQIISLTPTGSSMCWLLSSQTTKSSRRTTCLQLRRLRKKN